MPKIKKTILEIAKALKKSRTPVATKSKLKVAEVILNIMAKRKRFGLFVILGWQSKWWEYTDISDINQDIFNKHHTNLFTHKCSTKKDHWNIAMTLDFDGAILVDKNCVMMHSGVVIEGLRPSTIAKKLNPGSFRDLSEQFGFKNKVHTRHLSAITSSHIFNGTTVFTVSEETGDFHIFEGGRIIYST
jgi:DNA integrity scanning protein DisA with diadenylate cyclase activity